jgi:Fanconi anemia group M protein
MSDKKTKPSIIVDSREEPDVIERGRKNFDVTVEMMEVGDVQFGDLIIEHKEVADFISSIFDGRLSEQPINMSRFPLRFIIINGDFNDLRATDERYRAYSNKMIYGKIASLEINYDIRVLQVPTNRAFWILVDRLVHHANNPKVIERSKIYVPKISAEGSKDPVLSAYCTIDGISEKKAQLVKDKYDEVHKLCQASVDELCEIKGIGEKMATKMKAVFHM